MKLNSPTPRNMPCAFTRQEHNSYVRLTSSKMAGPSHGKNTILMSVLRLTRWLVLHTARTQFLCLSYALQDGWSFTRQEHNSYACLYALQDGWSFTRQEHNSYVCLMSYKMAGHSHGKNTILMSVLCLTRWLVLHTARTQFLCLSYVLQDGWSFTRQEHGSYVCLMSYKMAGPSHGKNTVLMSVLCLTRWLVLHTARTQFLCLSYVLQDGWSFTQQEHNSYVCLMSYKMAGPSHGKNTVLMSVLCLTRWLVLHTARTQFLCLSYVLQDGWSFTRQEHSSYVCLTSYKMAGPSHGKNTILMSVLRLTRWLVIHTARTQFLCLSYVLQDGWSFTRQEHNSYVCLMSYKMAGPSHGKNTVLMSVLCLTRWLVIHTARTQFLCLSYVLQDGWSLMSGSLTWQTWQHEKASEKNGLKRG